MLGFSDREARLCFGLALWNGRDPILKERLFGLAAPEGNHGEDVKELYYYLDSTPTHSYFKALYKYPLWAYPYQRLVREGRTRSIQEPEFEIEDSGVFDRNRYVDVTAEYAKASPTDVAIRVTLANRSGDDAILHVIPQLWFRNTWAWGRQGQPGYATKPEMRVGARRCVALSHEEMGRYLWEAGISSNGVEPQLIFTGNETNMARHFGSPNPTPFVKDAFHEYVVNRRTNAVNPANEGTKAGAVYRLCLGPRESVTIQLRLAAEADVQARLGLRQAEETVRTRAAEAERYYDVVLPTEATTDERNVLRQGYASLLWSKQFYNLNIADWIHGDPAQPAPPSSRRKGRNWDWAHLKNHDLISVPDKWEYPWYAAWDLAFHMVPFAAVDPAFARDQLALFLTERFIHPSGQLPAYEFAFSDVNPPVHAWACLRVFEQAEPGDAAALTFLASSFDALWRNFRWWQRLENHGREPLIGGGFLGLDNIGAFERGQAPPIGGHLEQADGTGWMAFFALHLLEMAIELGRTEPSEYDDIAVELFDHFASIRAAMNRIDGLGLWHDEDGFYYDHVVNCGQTTPMRMKSMVGVVPLFASSVLHSGSLGHLPKVARRIEEFTRKEPEARTGDSILLAVPSQEQLRRIVTQLLDETSFLAPTGVRSLSRIHRDEPFVLQTPQGEYRGQYAPDDSRTQAFGINSNWRGPVWFPLNYLLVEALKRYHRFYGDRFRLECPTGSGITMNLSEAAMEIERRLASTFLADRSGRRPCHGDSERYQSDPYFKDLILFYEYFSGDTGRGFGASHQTGWTTLVLPLIDTIAKRRSAS